MRLCLFLAMVGCADDANDCVSGFSRGDDGNCYEVDAGDGGSPDGGSEDGGGDGGTEGSTTFDDVLAAMPDCVLGETDGRLDLANGCADGACVDMTYDEIAEALGGQAVCESVRFEFGTFVYAYLSCDWAVGISSSFDDEDEDGVPDAGSTAWPIYVDLPWDGGTTDGLGPWASMSCFVEAHGRPHLTTVELDDDDEYTVSYMAFDTFTVSDDYLNKDLTFTPDGLADGLSLYGP